MGPFAERAIAKDDDNAADAGKEGDDASNDEEEVEGEGREEESDDDDDKEDETEKWFEADLAVVVDECGVDADAVELLVCVWKGKGKKASTRKRIVMQGAMTRTSVSAPRAARGDSGQNGNR